MTTRRMGAVTSALITIASEPAIWGGNVLDSEVLVGLHRHLAHYTVAPATSALGSLQFAGKVIDLAYRLRGSGVSTADRVVALGIGAGISSFDLTRSVLPALELLGWVRINRGADGAVSSVEDAIPPTSELDEAGDQVLAISHVDGTQSAALLLLKATILHPLERSEALQLASTYGDEAGERALRYLNEVNLVRIVEAADGRTAVFNPNIWVDEESATAAALKVQDSRASSEVTALIEEVRLSPGIPQEAVTSTATRWIDFAVSQGLVERSAVVTSEGQERFFLFTPHMRRDAFRAGRRDASGHVRQLVGSMVYAATYPRYRLDDPALFVQRLIERGRAGDASPIGTDYPMLETAGIVVVVPTSSTGRYALELKQVDVAEAALDVLRSRPGSGRGSSTGTVGGIFDQRAYRHVEGERARLAATTPTGDEDLAQLVAALRTVSRKPNG